MSDMEKKVSVGNTAEKRKAVYESPCIVYEGLISARASLTGPGGGSPQVGPDGQVSPEDLFSKP